MQARTRSTSFELLQQWLRVRAMKESIGATPYGGDLNKIPAKIVDAFVILAEEHARVENMRMARQPQSQQQNPRQFQQRSRR
jgi:hypothetical protein